MCPNLFETVCVTQVFLGCVRVRSRFFLCEEGSLMGVLSEFLLGSFFPLVLDVGAVGVVLLWWKNRCADKQPILMDCR